MLRKLGLADFSCNVSLAQQSLNLHLREIMPNGYDDTCTMAGCSKQFDFIFDGGLQSETRASLVNEVIKHLLYERNQIPLQFDILKQQVTVDEAKLAQNMNGKQHHGLHHSHSKAKNVISCLDQMYSDILKAFVMCPEIQQILIMLGSSPVTPKESYIINLPSLSPEADNISLKSSKQALFRHLVAEQVLSSDAALGPTSMYVVLCAPPLASFSGFVPKTSFKIPIRGYILTLNMICNQPSFCSQDLTLDETVEISGIEPLERSSFTDASLPVVASSFKSPSPEKIGKLSNGGDHGSSLRVRHGSVPEVGKKLDGESDKVHFHTPLTRSTPKVTCSTDSNADPVYIWFQSSTVIKGFRM